MTVAEQQIGELHFSVDGAFIMDLARNAYWFENRREWALDVMGTLQGMTVSQAMKVLRGEASLSGVDGVNSEIQYIERPDKAFQLKVQKHLDYLKEKADSEAREQLKENEENERRAILREDGFGVLRDFIEDEKPSKIIDPVFLGGFTVSKALLDDYMNTYVEHHFEPIDAASVFGGNNVKLMRLHKELRNSVGLTGMWGTVEGNMPDELDAELQKLTWKAIEEDKRTFERRRLIRAGVAPNDTATLNS